MEGLKFLRTLHFRGATCSFYLFPGRKVKTTRSEALGIPGSGQNGHFWTWARVLVDPCMILGHF